MIIGYSRRFSFPLVAPVSLATGSSGVTQSSITSSSISPDANSLLIAVGCCRGDGATDCNFTSMTTTLSTSGSWTLRQGTPTLGSARYVNTAIGIVRCSGTPGSGTVTMNFESLPWNQIYMIYHVTAGAASDLTSYPWKANSGTGTSVAVAFDSGPAATSLGFYACAEEGEVAGSFTVPGSTTELDNVVQSANLEMKTAYKLLSPATTNTWTGLDNTWADVAVSLEILQS